MISAVGKVEVAKRDIRSRLISDDKLPVIQMHGLIYESLFAAYYVNARSKQRILVNFNHVPLRTHSNHFSTSMFQVFATKGLLIVYLLLHQWRWICRVNLAEEFDNKIVDNSLVRDRCHHPVYSSRSL